MRYGLPLACGERGRAHHLVFSFEVGSSSFKYRALHASYFSNRRVGRNSFDRFSILLGFDKTNYSHEQNLPNHECGGGDRAWHKRIHASFVAKFRFAGNLVFYRLILAVQNSKPLRDFVAV